MNDNANLTSLKNEKMINDMMKPFTDKSLSKLKTINQSNINSKVKLSNN